MRWVAALIALLSGACQESISLGSECPSQSGPCSPADQPDDGAVDQADADVSEVVDDAATSWDGGGGHAGGITLDGGRFTDGGSGPRDAMVARDATAVADASAPPLVDAGPALFPAFQDPSFEITTDAGSVGALALARPSLIDPWYGCRSGMEVDSEVTLSGGRVVHPTEGATFFADSFPNTALNVSGLAQELGEPMRAGQRYAFSVDLWAETGALMTGGLELHVASGLLMYLGPLDCILSGITVIGNSGPIDPGAWRTVCVSFTPMRDVTTVTLMAGAEKDFTNWGARLFIDNIRSTPDCK